MGLKHVDFPLKKTFLSRLSVKKVMLTVVWDTKRIITIYFHNKGASVDCATYCQRIGQNSPYLFNDPSIYIYIYIYICLCVCEFSYLLNLSVTSRMQHNINFLRGVGLIWIKSFPSPKLATLSRLKNPDSPIYSKLKEKRWVQDVSEGIPVNNIFPLFPLHYYWFSQLKAEIFLMIGKFRKNLCPHRMSEPLLSCFYRASL